MRTRESELEELDAYERKSLRTAAWIVAGLVALVVTAVVLLLTGCTKRPTALPPPPPDTIDSAFSGSWDVLKDGYEWPIPSDVESLISVRNGLPLLPTTHFERGSWNPSGEAQDALRAVTAGLYLWGGVIVAEGWASDERRPEKGWSDEQEARYNRILARARARAVCALLTSYGLPEEQCLSRGMGEDKSPLPMPLKRRVNLSLP
jgi:hypothetical protein